ncbi:helix-turn-helix transcriptional regulator [Streptomyces sp. NRRL F-5755]|uniref:helix-turn-helix transcriptional regulator n=1 Tax=Streptomyces sp. NRRL F-5755 TaxID=1519475 RepID=UPI0007C6A59E|nr:helix-turn-helix transcriptional regulator [Streptomyces sp. NRRL F-5755]
MDRNTALGEFLRSRRARITPRQAGLSDDGGHRRVPGLRREEIAQLAGVSVDYYVRLERGRRLNVSETVLDAISRALRLDPVERTHLFQLAKPAAGRPRRTATRPQQVRPGLRDLLRILEHTPALVLGRRLDVLASNRMARALLTDFDALPPRERNLVRFMFRDETARSLYTHAQDIVASLRLYAGRHPHDPLPADLVGELSITDEGFRRWWADQNVHRHTHGSKHFHHPVAGPLTLTYESLTLPADPDQRLSVYTAEAGSSSEEALRLLAAWIRQPEPSHGQHADHQSPAKAPAPRAGRLRPAAAPVLT